MRRNPRRTYMRDGTEITPMDIANAKANGVTGVEASCMCGHEATIPFGDMPDDLFIPVIALRLRCSACGGKEITTRPDWPRRIALDPPKAS